MVCIITVLFTFRKRVLQNKGRSIPPAFKKLSENKPKKLHDVSYALNLDVQNIGQRDLWILEALAVCGYKAAEDIS